MICPTAKANNFFKWDWTGQIRLKRLNKFGFARKAASYNNSPSKIAKLDGHDAFHDHDLESLKAHVLAFVTACNFAKRPIR
jgi:hypothetical protein